MRRQKTVVITIDGPSQSGKSTVARLVAQALGFAHLETGAAYRAVAWAVLRKGADPRKGEAVVDAISGMEVALGPGWVLVNGEPASRRILGSREVEAAAPWVAAVPAVRKSLLPVFRKAIREAERVVVDGRDAGTVIWPWAQLKVFLTAGLEERAMRMVARRRTPSASSVEAALEDLKWRDRMDTRRRIGRLRPPPGGLVLDTGGRSPEDVAEAILQVWKGVLSGGGTHE